jgi:hypothetical protein
MPKNNWNPVAFVGPKSYCSCGHVGDGIGSQHYDRYLPGHGSCRVPDCPCRQFTWSEWTEEFAKHHNLK